MSETSPMDSKARAEADRASANGSGSRGGVGGVGGAGESALPLDLSSPPPASGPKSKTKGGTNLDTFIGKFVVDQGLATPEELQQCIEQARLASADGNGKTVGQIMLENDYITRRQLDRARQHAEAERSGQQIPGYKVLGKLGAGAMATVYKAKQLSLDRMVAIKILPKKFTSSTQFIERFYAEGRAAAALNHPNIVQAYDVGQSGELHYFVMEFVEGRTVYDDIVKNRRYLEADALDVVIQVAEALSHAHSKGLIHRDVKPKNIMLSKDGTAKLADMGLARAVTDKEAAEAEQGKAFGTPYYISPEQIRGELKIGPPADIYSLGATLYHMVTGNVPFDGKNPSAVMHKHLKEQPVPPDQVNPKLSPGVSEVIEMMMAKNPKDRYAGCNDLLVDLRAVREKKIPPIAHKDIPGLDMASVARAEAAAPVGVIPVDQSKVDRGISMKLVVTLAIALVISLTFNLVLGLLR